MAQYRAEILRPEVSYAEAIDRLNEMDDDVLVARLRPDMLAYHSTLNYRAWQAGEPEHEQLVPYLRHQVRADLLAAYFGEQDYIADAHLAFAHTRPYPTLVYLTPFNGNEEEEEDDDDFGTCNPVYRLNVLGICRGASEPEFDITGDTADDVPIATDVPVIHTAFGNAVYVPVTATSYATTSWTTATAPRPVRRPAIIPLTREDLVQNWSHVVPAHEQDTALEWLNAAADIQRVARRPERPRTSDLDVIDEPGEF